MPRGILTILLLVCSNAFMTLAWYGHIVFKSKLERVSLAAIVLLSWGVALFEYCFQVPANRIGSVEYGGPFTLWQLKVIQEVITLIVFSSFVLFFSKNESLQWNHIAGVWYWPSILFSGRRRTPKRPKRPRRAVGAFCCPFTG